LQATPTPRPSDNPVPSTAGERNASFDFVTQNSDASISYENIRSDFDIIPDTGSGKIPWDNGVIVENVLPDGGRIQFGHSLSKDFYTALRDAGVPNAFDVTETMADRYFHEALSEARKYIDLGDTAGANRAKIYDQALATLAPSLSKEIPADVLSKTLDLQPVSPIAEAFLTILRTGKPGSFTQGLQQVTINPQDIEIMYETEATYEGFDAVMDGNDTISVTCVGNGKIFRLVAKFTPIDPINVNNYSQTYSYR